MATKKDDYDWLNDPFDEKKIAEEQSEQKMPSKSCLIIVLAVIIAMLIVSVLSFSACASLLVL